jgi:DNA-binding CsgD family transcriptional regulator/tetratricopeptide (TPR) repeat protein
MSRTSSAFDPRSLLSAAAATTVGRLAPGEGSPDPRHLALLAESEPLATPPTWTDEAALFLAAQIAARARVDSLRAGIALIDRVFDGVELQRPAALAPATRAHLFAAAAEYCCSLGDSFRAAAFAAESLHHADTDALRYRALSLCAGSRALSGDYTAATADSHRAEQIFRERGWPESDLSFHLLAAQVVVGIGHVDSEALAVTAARLRTAQPIDPFWQYTACLADLSARLFRHDLAGALAVSAELISGSARHLSNQEPRLQVASARADALAAAGEYDEAIALLSRYDSPPGHGICFSAARATSLLSQGREREALIETDACVAPAAEHIPRTLVSVLARRAIAFQRLGQRRRALRSMEAALLSTAAAGNPTEPFFLLPPEETRALVRAAGEGRPELAHTVHAVVAMIDRVSSAREVTHEPLWRAALTPAERTLADELDSPLSLARIAAERGVSVNTVKSQARSIYRKLGVSGRDQVARQVN